MWIPERIEIAIKMIDRNSKNDKKISILDIGCGEGVLGKLLKELAPKKHEIFGTDIASTALKYAKEFYDGVYCVDIEKEEFITTLQRKNFDFIIALEVLEHLYKPENVLKQCYKILKEDGYFISSFPNIAWYKYRIDMLKGNYPKNYLLFPGEHIQNFTLHSFYRLLRENGFSPNEIGGQFIFPRIFKPKKVFTSLFKKFPNLFGYQIVVKSKKRKS